MNTTCLPEPPATMSQSNEIYFEVSQGPPVYHEEFWLHIDVCYFLSGDNGRSARSAYRTLQELVVGYIAKSRHIVQCELCPYPVRNMLEIDTKKGSSPLCESDMADFQKMLYQMDGQRYHLSFPS